MTKIFIRQSGQSGTFCLRIVSFNSALCLTISSSGYIRNCKPPIHTRWRNSTKLMNAAVTHCRIQNYKLNFTPEHHEGLQRSRDTVPHILNLDTKEKCCQLQAPAALSLWNPPPLLQLLLNTGIPDGAPSQSECFYEQKILSKQTAINPTQQSPS